MVFQALPMRECRTDGAEDSRENGFDCSGLVAHVYKEALHQLPHTTPCAKPDGRLTLRSSRRELVFYNTH